MFDVIAMGELLIDFTYHGRSGNGMRLFEQNPGGAPANVLCALANFGLKTAFVGKVGKDMHGDFLRSVLSAKGVDTSGLICDETVFTTLAFVELADNGERKFSFSRKPGADTCLTSNEVGPMCFSKQGHGVFHFGSLSLTNEPVRSATHDAIHAARTAGAIISCDPNYRAPLWVNAAAAAQEIREILSLVDIFKISDEETALITGKTSPKEAAAYLFESGISCVVVTLGKNGAYAATKDASVHVRVPDTPVIDTTGAGDAFWGGFLYQLVKSGLKPNQLNEQALRQFTAFANSVASLCVQRRGGIPAMPSLAEVDEFIKNNGIDTSTLS